MSYGHRVRTYREQRGWTQDELARRAAIPTATISRMETGARKMTLAESVILAQIFRITVDELAGVAHERAQRFEFEAWKAAIVRSLEDLKTRVQHDSFADKVSASLRE